MRMSQESCVSSVQNDEQLQNWMQAAPAEELEL